MTTIRLRNEQEERGYAEEQDAALAYEREEFGYLHEEHSVLSQDQRATRRRGNIQTIATIITVIIAALGTSWTFWAWASESHSQTKVNTQSISDIRRQLADLGIVVRDGVEVTSELRAETSALRVEVMHNREQRERVIRLLDELSQRMRDVEK